MPWSKILMVGGLVVSWFSLATKDRVITLDELIDLLASILRVLDLPVRIEIPRDLAQITAALQALPGAEVQP